MMKIYLMGNYPLLGTNSMHLYAIKKMNCTNDISKDVLILLVVLIINFFMNQTDLL